MPNALTTLNNLYIQSTQAGAGAASLEAFTALVDAQPQDVRCAYNLVVLMARLNLFEPSPRRRLLRLLLTAIDLALATATPAAAGALTPGASLFSIAYEPLAPLRLFEAAQACIGCPCAAPACPNRLTADGLYRYSGCSVREGRLHLLCVRADGAGTNRAALALLRALLTDSLEREVLPPRPPQQQLPGSATSLLEALWPASEAQFALLEALAGEDKCLQTQCHKLRNKMQGIIPTFPGVARSLQTLMDAAGRAREVRFLLDFLGYTFTLSPTPSFVMEPLPNEPLLRLVTLRLGGMLSMARAAAGAPPPPPPHPALHEVGARITATILGAVHPLDLHVRHQVLTCAAGPYALQPVAGPCALLAIFNYFTLTGDITVVAASGQPLRHGQATRSAALDYQTILALLVDKMLLSLTQRIANSRMLQRIGVMEEGACAAACAQACQDTLRAAELVGRAAQLPRQRLQCCACKKHRLLPAARALELRASGAAAVAAWRCSTDSSWVGGGASAAAAAAAATCDAPQGREALQHGGEWEGAGAFPCLDGSMEPGPITDLLVLLGIPFMHGYVPEPGSRVARLIGNISVETATAGVGGSLDPSNPQHRRPLRALFPHVEEGEVTGEALAECRAWLASCFPMASGMPGSGPFATPAGLQRMKERFHSEGGYAVQYGEDHFYVSHCSREGRFYQLQAMEDVADSPVRWRSLELGAGAAAGQRVVVSELCDAEFHALFQGSSGAGGGGAGGVSEEELATLLSLVEYLQARPAGAPCEEGGAGGGGSALAGSGGSAAAAAAPAAALVPSSPPPAHPSTAGSGLPPVHRPHPLNLSSTPSSSSSSSSSSTSSGGGAGGSALNTPSLIARLHHLSPMHANRSNRLLTAGCAKATVKEIMALADANLREARLGEEEERLALEPLADSPVCY